MTLNTRVATNSLTIQIFDMLPGKTITGDFIPYAHYEDTEEDLRKLTCKFTSYKKIDLTGSRWFIYTYYLKECIFSGVLLSSDYDENTGLYTYQCQDFNRWLTSKTWCVNEEGENSIYKLIKTICDNFTKDFESKTLNTFKPSFDSYYLPDKKEFELYPDSANSDTETGTNTTTNTTTVTSNTKDTKNSEEATTGFDQKPGVFYEDKTVEEILRSLISGSNAAVDMYVDNNNVLRFDPIKLKSWENPNSLYLTTRNLSGYTYKNDVTNMVTQVTIKDTDIYKNHTITEPNVYSAEDLMGFPLIAYYGLLNVFVQNTSSSSADTSSTGTSTDTTGTGTTDTTTDTSSGTGDASLTNSSSTSSKSKGKKKIKLQKGKSLRKQLAHHNSSWQRSGHGGQVRKAKSDDWGKSIISGLARAIRGK